MTFSVELVYDDTPPSLNTMGTRASHWPVTRAKQRWEGIWSILLLHAGSRGTPEAHRLPKRIRQVQAEASLRFPTAHRRDEGNYRWILEKSLGDALQKTGFLVDDTPDYFRFNGVFFEPKGPKRTTLILRYTP